MSLNLYQGFFLLASQRCDLNNSADVCDNKCSNFFMSCATQKLVHDLFDCFQTKGCRFNLLLINCLFLIKCHLWLLILVKLYRLVLNLNRLEDMLYEHLKHVFSPDTFVFILHK